MKEKLFLVVFGLLLGGGAFLFARPLVEQLVSEQQEATHFDSLEDFQRAMLRRDDRDLKDDESVSLRSIITPHPDSKIMYDLQPNLRVKFQGVPVRTNSCGMRGEELSHVKAPDRFRVAFLGDSFTFGWGVLESEAFPSVVQNLLQGYLGDAGKVEILNLGVPGYSTFQQVALFEEKGLEFAPDAVVLFFIENDFGLPFFIKNVHQSDGVVSAQRFARASWTGEDDAINAQKAELEQLLDPNTSIMRLARLGKRLGYKLFFAINPRPDWKEDYRRLPVLKQAKNLTFVPMRKPFMRLVSSRQIAPRDLSLAHDPHPSPVKHQLLGEILTASLLPQLHEWKEQRKAAESQGEHL